MNSREAILHNLRRLQRSDDGPAVWETRRRFPDPAKRFAESVVQLKGEVHRVDGLEAAIETLGDLLRSMGAERGVANDESPITDVDLISRFPQLSWYVVGLSDGDLRDACIEADVGVSGVEAALVETGSVVVPSGSGRSRLATLLPPVHLVLVPTSKLTTDLHTWTAARGRDIATTVTVISGPSKTADIEFTLTLGAHGPKRLIVILYDDRE